MINLINRIHGRKASIAAAVIAIALAGLSLYNIGAALFGGDLAGAAMSLLSLLLVLALLLPLRPRRAWLIALTGLGDAAYLVADIAARVNPDITVASPAAVTVLAVLLGSNLFLLIGAASKKRTEPLAALANLGWMAYSIFAEGFSLWFALPMAAYAAMLLLHPAIERPILGKITK